jgi:hypothetical protein
MPNTLLLNNNDEKTNNSLVEELKNFLKSDERLIKKFINSKHFILPEEKNTLLDGFSKEKWGEQCWRTSKPGTPLNKHERWHLRKILKSLENLETSKRNCPNIPEIYLIDNCFFLHIEYYTDFCDPHILKGLFRVFCKRTINFLNEKNIAIEYHSCSVKYKHRYAALADLRLYYWRLQ